MLWLVLISNVFFSPFPHDFFSFTPFPWSITLLTYEYPIFNGAYNHATVRSIFVLGHQRRHYFPRLNVRYLMCPAPKTKKVPDFFYKETKDIGANRPQNVNDSS